MPHLQKIPHLLFQIWLFTSILLYHLDCTHFLLEIRLDFLLMDPVLQKTDKIVFAFSVLFSIEHNKLTFTDQLKDFCLSKLEILNSIYQIDYVACQYTRGNY